VQILLKDYQTLYAFMTFATVGKEMHNIFFSPKSHLIEQIANQNETFYTVLSRKSYIMLSSMFILYVHKVSLTAGAAGAAGTNFCVVRLFRLLRLAEIRFA
jgi:hypothetical protein